MPGEYLWNVNHGILARMRPFAQQSNISLFMLTHQCKTGDQAGHWLRSDR